MGGHALGMATYTVTVQTPMAPADAFAYMADLRNFAEWDPGVTGVVQTDGVGGAADAEFDVELDGPLGTYTLHYATVAYAPSSMVKVRAESKVLTSVDTVTIVAAGDGAAVTYEAELELWGPLRLFDPLLGLAFQRIGDRAAAGLVDALDGERVSAA